MLARELVNKHNTFHQIVIGSPILPMRTSSLSEDAYANFLRTNVYLLKENLKTKVENNLITSTELVRFNNNDLIINEIEYLKNQRLLFNQGSFSVIFAPPQELNYVMQEIGRLREITFREVGEGTSQDLDIDKYDEYYHQLLIWDNNSKQIIGGYRLGMGAEFIEQKGIDGFYIHSLFRISKQMMPILTKTIELGRSFIIKDFQKNFIALMLLWKGILHVLLKHEHYRYLLGPVSISNTYSEISKTLIERYIRKYHFDYQKAKLIKPLNPRKSKKRLYVKNYLKTINSIELLDKLILDIEGNKQGLPVLIKKYLQLNGKVISFNIDYDFSEVLDALLLLDLHEVPEAPIAMLSKDMGIDAYQRFKQ
jgi:putative hemolysin